MMSPFKFQARRHKNPQRRAALRLMLERLEPRCLLTFITSNGDLNMADLPVPAEQPPIVDIQHIDGDGSIFTNQVSGAPFAVGGEIRTVSAHLIGLAKNGTVQPAVLPDTSGLLAITAIRGVITSSDPGGGVVATFTQGRTFFTSDLFVGDLDLPSTWNFGGTFAEYALKPPEAVLSGAPAGSDISFAASQVNVSAVNSLTTQSTQGRFLFREDSTAAQNAGETPGVAPGDPTSPSGGDNFLFNVDDVSPPDFIKTDEGFFADVDQTLTFDSLADIVAGTGFAADDLAALNAIAAAAFSPGGGLLPIDLDGVAGGTQAFASLPASGLGQPTDWVPQFPTSTIDPGPATGDFRADFQAIDYIGHQFTEEEGDGHGRVVPTGTTCQQYVDHVINGNPDDPSDDGDFADGGFNYTVKYDKHDNRDEIFNVSDPGAAFYYTTFEAPGGSFTVAVDQDAVGLGEEYEMDLTALQVGEVVGTAPNATCSTLIGNINIPDSPDPSVALNLPVAAGTQLVLRWRINPSSIEGEEDPGVTYTLNFRTLVNGSEVDSDPDGVLVIGPADGLTAAQVLAADYLFASGETDKQDPTQAEDLALLLLE